jgi:hypothetical protein
MIFCFPPLHKVLHSYNPHGSRRVGGFKGPTRYRLQRSYNPHGSSVVGV